MSLSVGGSERRSRSKSPGRRSERDKSPARGSKNRDKSPARALSPPAKGSSKHRDKSPSRAPSPSPNPYGNAKYEYDYAQPASYNYAATSPPANAAQGYAPPQPHPLQQQVSSHQQQQQQQQYPPPQQQPYAYSATPQYHPPPHQSPPAVNPTAAPGDHPSYANPSPYQHHNQAQAGYANYQQAGQQQQPPQQQYYSAPNAYAHGVTTDQTPYAQPNIYEYAHSAGHTPMQMPQEPSSGGRPPPSPRPEHARTSSYQAAYQVAYDQHGQPIQTPYPQPGEAQYAQTNPYQYQQPHVSSPQSEHSEQIYQPQPVKVHSKHRPQPSQPKASPAPQYQQPVAAPAPSAIYAQPEQYQYAQPDERVNYLSKSAKPAKSALKSAPAPSKSHRHSKALEEPAVVEIQPGSRAIVPSSAGLSSGLHRLSVSGSGPQIPQGIPPGSPLLEAYRGTYQSISPMPSPAMLASRAGGGDSDIEEVAPLSAPTLSSSDDTSPSVSGTDEDSEDEKAKKKKARDKKRVKFYDPEDDAKDLAQALKHSRGVDTGPLLDVLPSLSHDQMLQLRTEYKKHAKVSGMGINIAKHIKMKLGTSGGFGKICYATALGKWESEAYWANFWYQSHSSRRELLIESLMGRTNAEIRLIKESFSDKRYGDSLEKCMKAELPADKFRTAVLLALDEKRQEERETLYADQIENDVHKLYSSLTSREGSETAMIKILVLRSDRHIRELLRTYEQIYQRNFAKEMLRKSTNLVGETLAHILNGIINRPVRDALLVHQALNTENAKERTELLISRLVRMHWDRIHLQRIKAEYANRYGEEMIAAVSEGTKGEFGEFCVELLVRR